MLLTRYRYIEVVSTFPGRKDQVLLNLYDEDSYLSLKLSAQERIEGLKCGGFVKTYEAICDYHGVSPKKEICWDIDNLHHFNDVATFNLDEFKSGK
jgi:hypothetical protein